MKKIILCLILSLGLVPHSFACDECGGGSGSYYMGIMPQFSKHFVGVRYRNSSFQSHEGSLFATTDLFQTTELWARFYPSPRVQLMAFVPYQFNQQTSMGKTFQKQGLGDVVMLFNYSVINTTFSALPRTVNHTFLLGGGVKLPTGNYESNDTNVSSPSFQFGSGSTDFLVNTMYTLRFKRLGFSADATYKMNTRNPKDYLYGNRVSGTASVFFIQKLGENVAIMPTTGMYLEASHTDWQGRYRVDKSGGQLYTWNVGMETYWFKKLSVGATYQTIVKQNLSGGDVKANNRFVLHVSIML